MRSVGERDQMIPKRVKSKFIGVSEGFIPSAEGSLREGAPDGVG